MLGECVSAESYKPPPTHTHTLLGKWQAVSWFVLLRGFGVPRRLFKHLALPPSLFHSLTFSLSRALALLQPRNRPLTHSPLLLSALTCPIPPSFQFAFFSAHSCLSVLRLFTPLYPSIRPWLLFHSIFTTWWRSAGCGVDSPSARHWQLALHFSTKNVYDVQHKWETDLCRARPLSDVCVIVWPHNDKLDLLGPFQTTLIITLMIITLFVLHFLKQPKERRLNKRHSEQNKSHLKLEWDLRLHQGSTVPWNPINESTLIGFDDSLIGCCSSTSRSLQNRLGLWSDREAEPQHRGPRCMSSTNPESAWAVNHHISPHFLHHQRTN